jgi:GT2 family glycosyltransferase
MGRSAASNAGAAAASAEVLIFLDGDVLVGPDFVARHLNLHGSAHGAVVRGETWHLRQTRFLLDPELGSAMPGQEARVQAMSVEEKRRCQVTVAQVVQDFCGIEQRAQPAIYPGAGPRRLYDIEIDALRSDPACPVIWAAASGHNFSVSRKQFRASGGFDPALTLNEHRELALRLVRQGASMVLGKGVRSYHMTHRSGWRDPLVDKDWQSHFYAAHPFPEVALLPILWASLSDAALVPERARIVSLPALAAAAARLKGVTGLDSVVRAHLAGAVQDMAVA